MRIYIKLLLTVVLDSATPQNAIVKSVTFSHTNMNVGILLKKVVFKWS